ncbi:MAG: M48 family metalloprotease [Rickettsiaceae bacterium]|nr:M48 family metalloprotease [Rickettsiaceae bacterium]
MKKINLLNTLTKLSSIILLFCHSYVCFPIQILKDQEIEDGLKKLVTPIVKVGRIPDLKMHVLQDPSVNAFTAGGRTLYINTGCLISLPDPNMIVAIIAHEMGHIKSHHVSRKIIEIDSITTQLYSTLALSILAGMSFGEYGFNAAIAGGITSIEGHLLKNSRAMENAADQYACHTLSDANIDPQSLIDVFLYFSKIERGLNLKPYANTHPLSTQRAEFAQRCRQNFENSKQQRKSSTLHDVSFFKRIQLKLAAFSTDKIDEMLKKFEHDDSVNGKYVRSILYLRLKKFQSALKLADDLVAKEPDNAYFYQWQGQLLFNLNLYRKSIDSYRKAIKILPDANLIILEKIMVELEVDAKPRVEIAGEIYETLNKDKDNIWAYRLLISYSDKVKDYATKYYATACMYILKNKKKRARKFINLALEKAKKYTPIWYKIKDLAEEFRE